MIVVSRKYSVGYYLVKWHIVNRKDFLYYQSLFCPWVDNLLPESNVVAMHII
jgi:hypothetical protein